MQQCALVQFNVWQISPIKLKFSICFQNPKKYKIIWPHLNPNKVGQTITYILKNQTIICEKVAMCTGAIQCMANFSNQTHVRWELASHEIMITNFQISFTILLSSQKYFGAILPVCDTPSFPIKIRQKCRNILWNV